MQIVIKFNNRIMKIMIIISNKQNKIYKNKVIKVIICKNIIKINYFNMRKKMMIFKITTKDYLHFPKFHNRIKIIFRKNNNTLIIIMIHKIITKITLF